MWGAFGIRLCEETGIRHAYLIGIFRTKEEATVTCIMTFQQKEDWEVKEIDCN